MAIWILWLILLTVAFLIGIGIGYFAKGPDKWTPGKGGFGT